MTRRINEDRPPATATRACPERCALCRELCEATVQRRRRQEERYWCRVYRAWPIPCGVQARLAARWQRKEG